MMMMWLKMMMMMMATAVGGGYAFSLVCPFVYGPDNSKRCW